MMSYDKIVQQIFHTRHKEERNTKRRDYYQKNKDIELKKDKEYYLRTITREKLDRQNNNGKERFKDWDGFIPTQTHCECCGNNIVFRGKDQNKAIHFDHKNGYNTIIKERPTNWLRSNKRTKENEKLWKSHKFGYLCKDCNVRLPSKNRKRWLQQAVNYVFGEEYCIREMEN